MNKPEWFYLFDNGQLYRTRDFRVTKKLVILDDDVNWEPHPPGNEPMHPSDAKWIRTRHDRNTASFTPQQAVLRRMITHAFYLGTWAEAVEEAATRLVDSIDLYRAVDEAARSE